MVVDADEYEEEEEEEKSTYLADSECDRADALACGCVGMRMWWRADALVSRRG